MEYKYTEIIQDNLVTTPAIEGQFIFCTDSFNVYYDLDYETRVQIDQGDVFFLNKETDREDILSPLANKIYYVKETNTPYRYNGAWFKINDNNMILQVVFDQDEYIPVNIITNGKEVTVNTSAQQVIVSPNFTAQDEISQLTLLKIANRYAYAARPNQMEFEIPFPIWPYDFYKNKLNVVLRNQVISENKYTIQDKMLVFNDNYYDILPGESLLFTFYYNVYIDVNEDIQLSDKNIQPGAITEEKISNGSVSYSKLADDVKTKLEGITTKDDSITIDSAEKIKSKTTAGSEFLVGADKYISDSLAIQITPKDNLVSPSIIVRQMDANTPDKISKQIYLLDSDGNTSFPGDLSANEVYSKGQKVYSPYNMPNPCTLGSGYIVHAMYYNIGSLIVSRNCFINRGAFVTSTTGHISFKPTVKGKYLISFSVVGTPIKTTSELILQYRYYYDQFNTDSFEDGIIYDDNRTDENKFIGGTYSVALDLDLNAEVQFYGNINDYSTTPILMTIIQF